MNQEYKLYRISQLLSRFREQVKILNSNGEFSINIHAENILITVLNKIYGWNLENVNYVEGKTYASIDLRDKRNKVAVQVTSTANFEKIKHTLLKFIENDLYKVFDNIYIYIITEKQPKYNKDKIEKIADGKFAFSLDNILDRTDIYKILNKQNNLDKINQVCELLEKQFSDNKVEYDKWDLYCKGLNEYDKYIQNYFNYLEIKGFSPKINNTLVKINLENIYVPIELKIEDERGEDYNEFAKDRKKIIYTLDKAFSEFSKLVILGDPGSGKSTILKHLAYKICRDRSIESQFSDLVPVLIKGSEFAKFVSSTTKGLSEYIIDQFDKKYSLLFTEKLESKQLLVLVDGIDEINITSLRHTVVNRINGFIAQYPEIRIIVTSRIVGYKETRLNGYFSHFEVLEFKEEQIEKFITNWYLSIASNSDNDIEKAKTNAFELFNSIRQNKSVLNMASNPLLVTIITLIHYQGGTLPEKRVSLYDVATSTILENWVRQRETQRYSLIDKETLISILAPIAYYIHENFVTGVITESEFKKLFMEEYRKFYPYQNTKEEVLDLKNIIDFLREDAGFVFEKGINENGESLFGFVHQTFLEYFTAIEFKTRWKEGYFKDKLEKYVFNSNWLEVIKLSASLFKYSEQSRLGRQYATKFIKDIINVKDVIPEMYRPLIVGMQILIDDTEIEFAYFVEIINKIFDEILNIKEHGFNERYKYKREVNMFKYYIERLIGTKTYQNYLVERIFKEIEDKNNSSFLKLNLIEILMHVSENPLVLDKLLKVIKSNNMKLKKYIFNYNVVLPVAEIVFTQEFRDEIVSYVNSESFLKSYNGYLPTQYHCAFAISRKGDIETYLKEGSFENLSRKDKEERLQSIRLIKNEKMRIDFINYHVFSVGIDKLAELKEFIEQIKNEFQNIELPKIEKYIKELEKFESYNLSEYEIINFHSTKIFLKKDNSKNYAFLKDDFVKFLDYPFNEKDLLPYFGKETKDFLRFLDLIFPNLINPKIEINIKDFKALLNFIKYQKTIHWYYELKIENMLNYWLKCLFDLPQENIKTVLNWLKSKRIAKSKNIELEEDFNKKKFISKVTSSNLELHDQLFLLKLVGEKTDYEKIIIPTIESLKETKSEEKKKEIKEILYEIL